MIRRDIRTNSLVDDDEVQDIRNEIVDILSDASLNEKLGENGIETAVVPPLSKKAYFEKPEILQSLKIPDLRNILRYYKDAISFKSTPMYSAANMKRIKLLYDFALNGTKQRIIERIARFFTMDSSIIHLQKLARGRFVRQNNLTRGPALKDRSICINNTDFYSMEPLVEIEFDRFFSYSRDTPTGKYVYGFDHNSLLELLKNRTSRLQNPYNREDMTSIIPAIRKVERLQKIIANSQLGKQERSARVNISPVQKPKSRPRTRETPLPPPSPFITENDSSTDRPLVPAIYPLAIMRANIGSESNNYDIPDMISKIRAIRLLTFAERAQNLFMEIDQLGNYTQVEWFTNLTRRDNMRYYRLLHDIWSYRAQISNDVKRKICPMWDPFSNFTNEIVRFNVLTDDEIRTLCLRTMEDIIFTGVAQEFRVLGAFHVLSALTIVSNPARNSMMWLYESVMY